MKQSKADLERWYADKVDPWDYSITPDDHWRKRVIVQVLRLFGPFSAALDIGAGEGWITRDLPASTKHGIELSDTAAQRFPLSVVRVHKPIMKYDLVLATGVLYAHYDVAEIISWIREAASDYILTCSIQAWEPPVIREIPGKQIFAADFPYREFHQQLRIFKL